MCGIAGVLDFRGDADGRLERTAAEMADCLAHRGPDDHGLWSDAEAGIALAHRRLSILDLSPAGHQPMTAADGRFIIVYNGEVYSHDELRPELDKRGILFRGHSDTEVMLEAFAAFGIEPTVKRLIGMFTIALWDRRERTLTLVRDRLGIKPLYWAKFGGLFLFGSELKALRAYPGWTPRIDRAAVAAFMRHNYIPAPHTIYQGVQKLEPGTMLTCRGAASRKSSTSGTRAKSRAQARRSDRGSDRELTDQLETLLTDAVRRADDGGRAARRVPVWRYRFLDSGRTDAGRERRPGAKTFTIGFDIAGYDEAPHAAAVAAPSRHRAHRALP